MSINGFKKLFMASNSQYYNDKQKKARARKVNNENVKNYSTEMEEVNPLLQQIELLKAKAMEWQEEIKNQDETSKLAEKIVQLEELSKRLEEQIRQLDSADGRIAEQTHQIGKKIAYQMGQITDRFDELERELSRDLNESFAEMLEKLDTDVEDVKQSDKEEICAEQLEKVKAELLNKMDDVMSNKVTPATSEKVDQLKADIFARMDRELLNKTTPVTEQKLEEAKVEIFSRIDRALLNKDNSATDQKLEMAKLEIVEKIDRVSSAVQDSGYDIKLDEAKMEILRKIDLLASQDESNGIDEKLEALKTEIFEHVHKECVKQYRNIQLLFDEESTGKDSGAEAGEVQKEVKTIGKSVRIAVGLGLLNFVVLLAYILMQLKLIPGV